MNKLTKGLVAATGAIALGVGSVAITAVPAFAYDDNVNTQTMEWSSFNSTTASINDNDYYDNNYGIFGWTHDIFDEYFETYVYYDGGGETQANNWIEDTNGIDNGALSTWTGHQTVTIDGNNITLNLTVTFDGNYVRYDYGVSTTGDISKVEVDVDGTSGANGSVCYNQLSATELITIDLYDGSDSDCDVTSSYPDANYVGDSIGAYQLIPGQGAISAGWEVANGNDGIVAYELGAPAFSVVVGAFDYNAFGGFALAYAHAEDVTPNLSDHFGEQTKTFGNDFSIADATFDGTEKSFPVINGDSVATEEYLNDGSVVWADGKVSGLPAGVTATFEQDETTGDLSLKLSGTPTETGTFTPEVVLYHPTPLLAVTDEIGDDAVYFTFNLTAGGLPDTGMSAAAMTGATIGGISLLVVGAAVLLFRRRQNG
jgi:hypothetical protein